MNYLLEFTGCIAIFYALYLLIFSRLTFVRLNRIYLLLSLAISLCIPLISYHQEEIIFINESISEADVNDIYTPLFLSKNLSQISKLSTIKKPFDWIIFLQILYVLGVFFMFFKLFIFIIKILKVRHLQNEKGYISTKGKLANSSFLNLIFIDDAELSRPEIEQIIAHEKWHIRLFHSYDLLFVELLKMVFWFNPILWFWQRSLSQVHEYEVDNRMVQAYNPQIYASLLLKLANATSRLSMVHQFSRKPLTDRIHFLFTKQKSTPMKRLSYLFILPILGVLLTAFSVEKVVKYQVAEKPDEKYFKIARGENHQMEITNDMTKVSSLRLLKDEISLAVSYDKISKELIEEAGKYFKKYGFTLQTVMSVTNNNKRLTTIEIALTEDNRETKVKQRKKGTYEMSNDGSIFDLDYWRKENKNNKDFISIIANKKTGQHSVSHAQLSIPLQPIPPLPPSPPPAPVNGKTKLSINNFERKIDLGTLIFNSGKVKISVNMTEIKNEVYIENEPTKNADYKAFLDFINQDVYFSKKFTQSMIPDNWNNVKSMNNPVIYVSYDQANEFCKWKTETFTYQFMHRQMADYATILKENSKQEKKYKFRLPTSEEWAIVVEKGLNKRGNSIGFCYVLDLT